MPINQTDPHAFRWSADPFIRGTGMIVAASAVAIAFSVTRSAYPLEFQERCAEQAAKAVDRLGYDPEKSTHRSHYNPTLQKCFVRVTQVFLESGFASTQLADVHELTIYGQDESSPAQPSLNKCYVASSGGARKNCDGLPFDVLAIEYMPPNER